MRWYRRFHSIRPRLVVLVCAQEGADIPIFHMLLGEKQATTRGTLSHARGRCVLGGILWPRRRNLQGPRMFAFSV